MDRCVNRMPLPTTDGLAQFTTSYGFYSVVVIAYDSVHVVYVSCISRKCIFRSTNIPPLDANNCSPRFNPYITGFVLPSKSENRLPRSALSIIGMAYLKTYSKVRTSIFRLLEICYECPALVSRRFLQAIYPVISLWPRHCPHRRGVLINPAIYLVLYIKPLPSTGVLMPRQHNRVFLNSSCRLLRQYRSAVRTINVEHNHIERCVFPLV